MVIRIIALLALVSTFCNQNAFSQWMSWDEAKIVSLKTLDAYEQDDKNVLKAFGEKRAEIKKQIQLLGECSSIECGKQYAQEFKSLKVKFNGLEIEEAKIRTELKTKAFREISHSLSLRLNQESNRIIQNSPLLEEAYVGFYESEVDHLTPKMRTDSSNVNIFATVPVGYIYKNHWYEKELVLGIKLKELKEIREFLFTSSNANLFSEILFEGALANKNRWTSNMMYELDKDLEPVFYEMNIPGKWSYYFYYIKD
jgi:hypothetical protein